MCVTMRSITAGYSIIAMILSFPTHAQRSISMSKEHLSYCTSRSGIVRAAVGDVSVGYS
jgi:hypothetical protein